MHPKWCTFNFRRTKIIKENNIRKLVLLSVLAALGIILMIVEITYPPVPYLKIEVSDIVVLIAFAIFGFKGGLTVGIIKTLGDLLIQGASGPFGIGQITALMASISYVLLFAITRVNVKEDSKKQLLFKYIIIVIAVTMIMTVSNYIFITPIYSGKIFWFQLDDGFTITYFLSICSMYIPFNFIKGSLILLVHFVVAKRILLAFENYTNEQETL